MYKKAICAVTLLLMVLSFVNVALATDVLVLKDGTQMKGTLVSRDAQVVKFKTKYSEGTYPVSVVKSLTLGSFSSAPAAPATPVAAAPKTAPVSVHKIWAGSTLQVKVEMALSSKMPVGTKFKASLASPLSIGDTMIPVGTKMDGVVSASGTGDGAKLIVKAAHINFGGKDILITTQGAHLTGPPPKAPSGPRLGRRGRARRSARHAPPKTIEVPVGKVFETTVLKDAPLS